MKCNPYQLCFSLAGFAALGFTTPHPTAAATLKYSITDLGSLNPNASGFDAYSTAYSINNSGQVAGNSVKPNTDVFRSHAFRTASNTVIDPATDDLGTLGGNTSKAYGINDLGQVVGESNKTIFGFDRTAFLWNNTSGMQDLGTLGGLSSMAYGINNSSQVVGTAETANNAFRAFLYNGSGSLQDLGTLGGVGSEARSINSAGHIVGKADTTEGDTHAFLYNGSGSLQDLGTLGGDNSNAYGINDLDQIVGVAETSATYEPDDPKSEFGTVTHAFLYSDGEMIDLGTLGGPNSTAYDINDTGQVVGTADSSDTSGLPFVYSDGEMTDLNDLIPSKSKWVLGEVRGINNAGQIVGTGTIQDPKRNYPTHAFVLTPVPEPASVLGTLAFGAFAANRMLNRKRK